MSDVKNWYVSKKVEKTVNSLRKNGFKPIYVPTREMAVGKVLELVPRDALVGIGGSVSIRDLGLVDLLVKRGNKIANHWLAPPEGLREAMKQELNSDVFLSSSNAITEDGELVNVDNAGNRVAAMIFGPKKVLIVAGLNKVVKDLDGAMERMRDVACPMNAKRLNRDTPCVATGECSDCDSPRRLCRIITIMNRAPADSDITIVLVGEEMGY